MDAQSAMEAIHSVLQGHYEGAINPIKAIGDINAIVCEWRY